MGFLSLIPHHNQLKLTEPPIYTEERGEREREMEVVQVLHMNGGIGETSYANNSLVQVNLISNPLPRIFSNYIQIVDDFPTYLIAQVRPMPC